MNKLRFFLIFLFVLCIPVIAILGSFRLTAFNMYFYEEQFNDYEPDVDDAVEITASTLYFLKEKDAGVEYISEYNHEEQEHLVEVKKLIHDAMIIFYFAFGVLIIAGVLLYIMDKNNFLINKGTALFYGGGFSTIIISVFLLLISCCFDSVFVFFHQLFFKTTWRFSSSSLLIRLFPKIFFVDIIVKIVIGAYAVSMFLNIAGFYLVKKEKYLEKKK